MRKIIKQADGYVLISTLFFLFLSGLLATSIIQISGNHLLQLRQLNTAYEAKAALNMTATVVLEEYEGHSQPVNGSITTNQGEVKIKGKKQGDQVISELLLTKENGHTYKKEIIWLIE